MHYSVLVIVPPQTDDIPAYVDKALAPFDENDEKPHDCGWSRDSSEGCEFCRQHNKWDWFVIGGRWAGLLGAYEPMKDRRNYERCWICGGTGTRPDWTYGPAAEWARSASEAGHPVIGRGCNVCHGTGWSLKHPPDFVVPADGNMRPIAEIPENVTTYAVVTPEGGWVDKQVNAKYDEMPDDQWTVEWSKLVARYAPDHLGIVVDVHS